MAGTQAPRHLSVRRAATLRRLGRLAEAEARHNQALELRRQLGQAFCHSSPSATVRSPSGRAGAAADDRGGAYVGGSSVFSPIAGCSNGRMPETRGRCRPLARVSAKIPKPPLSRVSRATMKVALLLPSATLPAYATPGSAGLDLAAAQEVVVPASQLTDQPYVRIGRALVRTGIAIQLPKGSVGRIGSRSGLSVRSNLEVGAGWIDPDYRGEVLVELKNFSDKPVTVLPGDRIAQLFILPTIRVTPRAVSNLPRSRRGNRGIGSSGS